MRTRTSLADGRVPALLNVASGEWHAIPVGSHGAHLPCPACWELIPSVKFEGMTKAAEAVLVDALRLDLDGRAEVAAELLASLDGPADPDVEAAWAVEIERRVAAIEVGTVRLEPWAEVKRRIEKEILGR